MKTDSIITIDGVVNSISQACGKLSFQISNYLYSQKEGRKRFSIKKVLLVFIV